ncbi:hypothetical protein VTL71DRAFT_2332, partial [Oculimacula yallundae]
IKRIAG